MSFMVGPVNGYGVSSFCGYFQKVYGANGYSVEQSLDVFWLIQKQMKRKHFNPRREHSDMGKEGWRSVCRGLVEAHMCEEQLKNKLLTWSELPCKVAIANPASLEQSALK
ncbi:uncharacterized protein LOC130747092 isoform X3 [Lotus japonicus]|uniref:uncharacterized protein LOC130747092 isoform X3 n=1 Tax=Lotus japonicus TaxID=34305 RepID=UPI00258630B0|nr:uncharacterized protein LOC130747092 isoform X3 [Lotus japonicus]